jgi:hypothetical protein
MKPEGVRERQGKTSGNHAVALGETNETLRRFDSETGWLAAGLVGLAFFGALTLAANEWYQYAADHVSELSKEVDVSGKSSTGETTAGLGSRIDRGFSEVSQEENRTTQMEAATSTPTPVLASTPEINDMSAPVAASLRSPAYQQDHARSIRLKITRARSSRPSRPKFVDVRVRLIALWHQSLVRSERSRSWTQFSNLNKGERKIVGHTAQLSHWALR